MPETKTEFIGRLGELKKSLGVRLDILDSIHLFKTRQTIANLMLFLSSCGVKFLNIGSIFARLNGRQISSFAVDENILTAALFGENFPQEDAINFTVSFFNGHNTQASRVEFSKFCDKHDHWIDSYSMYRALVEQIGANDFSKWPEILRVCIRRNADVIKRQLSREILRHKILQFFARKQLALIKKLANDAGIFLCCDCDVLCDVLSADVWSTQKSFFVNSISQATVFTGFPPSDVCHGGIKTTKVPYRIGYLKNSNYELFGHMFSNLQSMADAIFLVNGHSIFQYWEIACTENNPKYGRWVNMPTDVFFKYLDHHFNNFPYLFDFNEPLLPSNEVISKRHGILQMVISGEPTAHSCDVYNLSRKLFAIASPMCNRKVPHANGSSAEVKTCLDNFRGGEYVLCVLHFMEICGIAKCTEEAAISNPTLHGRSVGSFACVERPKAEEARRVDVTHAVARPNGADGKPAWRRIVNAFRNIFR
ncbi:MAG: 4-alpha-glucanotransferase [Puniceicoccales bacterium]|jgi:hypothetical protein|nr:4-alpha-glucanotransferase [Puniceicoccales bacterium]